MIDGSAKESAKLDVAGLVVVTTGAAVGADVPAATATTASAVASSRFEGTGRSLQLKRIRCHEAGGNVAVQTPSTISVPSTARGLTRSGWSAVFTADRSSSYRARCSATRSPPATGISRSIVSASLRLTTKTASSPVPSSYVAVLHNAGTRPKAAVSISGPSLTAVRNTVGPAYRAVNANGWKIVCRHARPPGSVRIGPITFTSCARQAIFTRSACRSNVISKLPTTTASSTL